MFVYSSASRAQRSHSAAVVLVPILLIALLSGCAGLGVSHAPSTASISVIAINNIDPSDWNVIKAKLARIPNDRPSGTELAWQNPQTGSAGTITALAAMANGGGHICRAFSSTINDF